MNASTLVPNDHPLMIAWKAHQETEDFKNSAHWAAHPEHLQGSLWALFMAGYRAGEAELKASERRLYDALFILMGSLPPTSLAGQHCHVCDPQAGERLRNIADTAMKAASCCTFTNSTSDLTYERNALRDRLNAACTLLRRTLPMHYRGLTIDADIQAFLAEIKTDPAAAETPKS